MSTQHKLLMTGPPGYLSRWTCKYSCGLWESEIPDVGPWGRTTAKARIGQVEMAHGKHVKAAAATAQREVQDPNPQARDAGASTN